MTIWSVNLFLKVSEKNKPIKVFHTWERRIFFYCMLSCRYGLGFCYFVQLKISTDQNDKTVFRSQPNYGLGKVQKVVLHARRVLVHTIL